MNALNNFLFIGLPYIAIFVFLVGTIYRNTARGFKVSSLSSEFLEGKQLFWGSVPFHWGMMFLFFGHLVAFLFPKGLMAFNSHPVQLLIIEISAFAFAVSALIGLLNLLMRRTTNARVTMVSNWMDYTILYLLIFQVVTGLLVAFLYRWGSTWFAAVLTPYLKSIFTFRPEIEGIAAMPWMLKLHALGAFVIVLLIPFSRLVHFLVVPIQYIWRPYQVVVWYWQRKKIRKAESGWSVTQPKNN